VDTILISVFFWVFGQACFATARGIILEIVRKGKKNREKYVELRTKKAHGHYSTKGATLDTVNVFLSLVHTARQVMGVASTRSRIANPQGKRPPTVSLMTGTKFRRDSTELAEVRRTNSTRRA
jgi:hypothetical protein